MREGFYEPRVALWCDRPDEAQEEAAKRSGRLKGLWIVPAELQEER